jgi:hypothetical protein
MKTHREKKLLRNHTPFGGNNRYNTIAMGIHGSSPSDKGVHNNSVISNGNSNNNNNNEGSINSRGGYNNNINQN